MNNVSSLSRRGLLKLAGGAIMVNFSLAGRNGFAQNSANSRPLDPSAGDSFLAIHGDGSVATDTSKVDVGTGLATTFRQTAAEEIGIPVERFTVVEGDTALTPDHGGTGGSSGIPCSPERSRPGAYQTLHAFSLTMGCPSLHENAR